MNKIILVSGVVIAAIITAFALFMPSINYCRFEDPIQSDRELCEAHSLISWIFKYGNWPYGEGILEPYLILIASGVIAYVLWFYVKTGFRK